MKLLKEENGVLFGANEIQKIRNIVAKSSIDRVIVDNENKTLVDNILNKLYGSSNVGHNATYLALKAASYGPDTRKNPLLNYINEIGKSQIISNYPKNVNSILDMISSKKIEYKIGNVDVYLKNPSLYNRNKDEFEYSALAFDAVINKRDTYFDCDNHGMVYVDIDYDTGTSLFKDQFSLENSGKNKVTAENALVEVDQKFFFYDNVVGNGKIIPAGLGGRDSSKRTIWNYMEIWTNSSNRSAIDDDQTENRRNIENNVKKAKDIIKNSNISDENRQFIAKVMDDLS